MVRAIKTISIVKKRRKKFIRFQSDRFDRVKVRVNVWCVLNVMQEIMYC